MRPALALTLLLTLGAALPACSIRPRLIPDTRRSEAMAFPPVSMEIHPLSRIQAQDGRRRAVIDAHIVFTDQAGDEVKSVGMLRIELYRERGPVEGLGERDQIERWAVDLTDPTVNADAYDRVTRTYRFRLEGAPPESRESESFVLRAWLRLPSGTQLIAQRRISG